MSLNLETINIYIFKPEIPIILHSHPLLGNEKFLQYLAFGAIFDKEKARERYRIFSNYRRRWLVENSNLDWHKLDNGERVQFISVLFNEIIREFIGELPNAPLVMGLSSGLDSRLIYHALQEAGVKTKTYTFGQVGNKDYDVSVVMSSKLGLPVGHVDTSEIEWSLGWYDKTMGLVNDTVFSPRYMASKVMLDKVGAHYDIHGYLNDVIIGKGFKGYIQNDWDIALKEFKRKNDTFCLQSFLDKSLVASFLPTEPFTDHAQIRYQHQLNLAFRQEQRIRPQDHAGIRYLLPFNDWRWIGFWLSREDNELINRSLYREFIAGLQSEIIFDIPDYEYEHAFNKKNTNERKILPRSPHMHFCMYSCYRNNPSFRRLVDTAVGRMKKRRLMRKRFIEKVMNRFLKKQRKASKHLLGIVSTDIAIESGMF